MFGSNKDVEFDGIGSDANANPGIYMVTLKDVKYEESFKTEDDKTIKARIKFNFQIEDVIERVGNLSSTQGAGHTHIEYEVRSDEQNAEVKAANLVKRVGHILSKFIAKEQLAQENESFDSYGKWVAAKLVNKPYAGKKFKLVVAGSVYDKKSNSRCPNYPPFIAREADNIAFDKNAMKGNNEFLGMISAAAGDAQLDAAMGGSSPASDFV